MIRATADICNTRGLHARASAKFTKLAGSFPCEVWMSRGERRVNAKSIMGVMMLAAGKNSKVKFIVTGDDAPAMAAELEALFARKFDEA